MEFVENHSHTIYNNMLHNPNSDKDLFNISSILLHVLFSAEHIETALWELH